MCDVSSAQACAYTPRYEDTVAIAKVIFTNRQYCVPVARVRHRQQHLLSNVLTNVMHVSVWGKYEMEDDSRRK